LMIFPEDVGSRIAIYSETLMPGSSASELVSRTQTYPLQQLGYAFDHPLWPYGYGIGTCTLGIQYVVRILKVKPMYIGVESGFGNLIVELGIVGLLLWIVLGCSISFSAWKVVTKLKGTPWFPLSFVMLVFAVLLFFPMSFISFTFYQDFVINSFFWLFLGILFRLPKFAEVATNKLVQEAGRQA
jgi:O-antigen ligase